MYLRFKNRNIDIKSSLIDEKRSRNWALPAKKKITIDARYLQPPAYRFLERKPAYDAIFSQKNDDQPVYGSKHSNETENEVHMNREQQHVGRSLQARAL